MSLTQQEVDSVVNDKEHGGREGDTECRESKIGVPDDPGSRDWPILFFYIGWVYSIFVKKYL